MESDMSKLTGGDISLLIIGIFVGIFIGVMLGTVYTSKVTQKAAIEHKAAQFNPTTGKFEWIKPTTKEQ